MLQLGVIPRSLSAMYRQICPLTSSRTGKERENRVCKTHKGRRKAHDPINFQITPRKGAPRLSTAPLHAYIGTYERIWRGNKWRNCLSQHAFRDTDIVLQSVKALRRKHISLHCSETFQRYRSSLSAIMYSICICSLPEHCNSLDQTIPPSGGRCCVKIFIRDPLAWTSRKRSL